MFNVEHLLFFKCIYICLRVCICESDLLNEIQSKTRLNWDGGRLGDTDLDAESEFLMRCSDKNHDHSRITSFNSWPDDNSNHNSSNITISYMKMEG